MIQEIASSVENEEYSEAVAERRRYLAQRYAALPSYGSSTYWHIVEELDRHVALPLEVIVKCLRVAIAYGDDVGRNRILEILFRRISFSNEHWAQHVLRIAQVSATEQALLVHDLYADICEGVIRAVMDPTRQFWEENFLHCLSFERKHVYRTFQKREGRWYSFQKKQGNSGPTQLTAPIEQPGQFARKKGLLSVVEDEVARKALLAVEQSDLPALIIALPDKLKAVIWLLFWEDRTEKDVARILGISDRTVRNRLKHALQLLHEQLEPERDIVYG